MSGWEEQFPPELLDELRDARVTLPAFGQVLDQATGRTTDYDPNRIAPELQWTILDFYGNPPRDEDGRKKWLTVLSSRQVGKSFVSAAATYVRTAYSPGSYSAVIADIKERAEDLFRNINLIHEHLPDDIRMPTIPNRESRQLTFLHGGKLRTLSAESNMVGIGRAVDNLHASEIPFWGNAAEVFNGLIPAFINRAESAILMESTPAPMHHPSAEWYRDQCAAARRGQGRWLFCFVPFFQSRLNERRWQKDWHLTQEEAELMEKFGGEQEHGLGLPYLTLENLAFRREMMDVDQELRRNPDLFKVFYPTDPLTCWQQSGGAAIPAHALTRHQNGVLVPWNKGDTYKAYANPRAGALYVIGAVPAGWMGGDEASFQVLEIWEDRWEQVATFSSNEIDPPTFAALLIDEAAKWNDATIVVESNGVGLGTLAILVQAQNAGNLKNLYYSKRGVKSKPGIAATKQSVARALGLLIDALIDKLVLRDEDLVEQLSTYRHDKATVDSEARQLLSPGKLGRGRRAKHHWDKVSSLLWAVVAAYEEPVKFRPSSVRQDHGEVAPSDPREFTADQWTAHVEEVKRDDRARARALRKAGKGKKMRSHWTKNR